MILKNLRKTKDGNYDFDFTISEEENEFLLDFAIQELIKQGLISITKADQEFAFLDDFKEGTLQ